MFTPGSLPIAIANDRAEILMLIHSRHRNGATGFGARIESRELTIKQTGDFAFSQGLLCVADTQQ